MLVKNLEPLIAKNNVGKYSVDPKQGFKVVFEDFGDSSVDLFVICWTLVEEKAAVVAQIKEIIYNTLNANHIEIPFPQQDIYVRHIEMPKQPGKKSRLAKTDNPEPAEIEETVGSEKAEKPAKTAAKNQKRHPGRPRKTTKETTATGESDPQTTSNH